MYTPEELADIEDFEGCTRFIVFCLLISSIVFICPRLDKHLKNNNAEQQQLCIDYGYTLYYNGLCLNDAIPINDLYTGE